MTDSGGGAPYGLRSSVVCASPTSVRSYPRTKAPWIVDRTQASVWGAVTTRWPTSRSARRVSRFVASHESPYVLCTTGSDSSRMSSGTYCHCSLPVGRSSLECCTQRTGTSSGVLHPEDRDV